MTRRTHNMYPGDGCFLIPAWVSNSIQMCETPDQSIVQINSRVSLGMKPGVTAVIIQAVAFKFGDHLRPEK